MWRIPCLFSICDSLAIKFTTKKPPCSEQDGFFVDQAQVFPCFHRGGSLLLTELHYAS